MQPVRANLLRNFRVHGNQGYFCTSLFSTEAKSSFLNKGEVTNRVLKVLKQSQKVDPSKVTLKSHHCNFLCQPWQTAVYRAGSNSVLRPYYEVHALRAFNFSSVASPVAEKDAEEGTSTTEEVKPVTNDATQKVETEEASKSKPGEEQGHGKQEDNEALLKLVAERQAQLDEKGKQLGELKQRVLSSMAELGSVKERLRREAESTKKYAIQDFAKGLLDVADNLGRAVATVAENVRKEVAGNTTSETAKFLRSLLEGVIMTEKELMKVLKKFGVEKFEPVGEQFDPNSHLALFEVPDPSKEAGTVAVVVKAGYMLHDRVLRPAEVGVVRSLE